MKKDLERKKVEHFEEIQHKYFFSKETDKKRSTTLQERKCVCVCVCVEPVVNMNTTINTPMTEKCSVSVLDKNSAQTFH